MRKITRLALFILLFLISPSLRGEDGTFLIGRVLDESGKPLPDSRVTISLAETPFRSSVLADQDGFFKLSGIPAGDLQVVFEHDGFRPFKESRLVFEPGRQLYVKIRLEKKGSPAASASRPVWTDLSNLTGRTIIDDLQIRALPSACNFWSLLENQDLSATTNRIDVGGVWASLPALWSSRGSSSWTQSSYLVNGMDVTDPLTTGLPLFYPDIAGIRFAAHSNGQHPIPYLSPGGSYDLIPKEGSSGYHGTVSAFITTPGMTTTNITPRLEKENLSESHKLNSLRNFSVQMSGPVLPGKLFLFASMSQLNLSRDIAEFPLDDKGSVSSGLLNLTYRSARSSLQFFWTGQIVKHPTYGAERRVPFSSTLDQKSLFNIAQVIWKTHLRPDHALEIGASFGRGNIHSDFQDAITEPHGFEVFQKIPSGAAAMAGRSDRTSLVLSTKGTALLGSLRSVLHRVEYGFSLKHASASSKEEILDNIHLHFYGNTAFEIVRYDTPLQHEESALNIHVFGEDTITLPNLAALSIGLHLVSTRGWAPGGEGGKITWLQLSPRVSVLVPLFRDKSLAFRLSAARYYFELPLSYLTYGNPRALGGLAYSWTDANQDHQFQEDEKGDLWRREGPFYAQIDSALKRPFTDEYSAALTKTLPGGWTLALAGFYRETRNLIESLNTGVPLDAYDPVPLFDPGDDRIPGTEDDRSLTVFDQKRETLGQDFFFLTNPEGDKRISRYRGVDLTLVKKFSLDSVFFFSATASEAIGTTSPGNTELENDDGIIGTLYDNPNAFLHARGRLRFDRAYTARIGTSVPFLFGFRLAGLIKYYDGQPFARKIIVTGLNQGPFYVQAYDRGRTRYEFNMTVDARLEKIFSLGRAGARIFIEGYNIFNWANATAENEWTGPEFGLRYAVEVESPRVCRLGISYEF
jgi:hypothetical protein